MQSKKAKIDFQKKETRMVKKHDMWCGTLQFEYDTNQALVARNMTHEMPIDEPFDFKDYAQVTDTRPCPPTFQTLVQNAIQFYLDQRKHGSLLCQFFKHNFPLWQKFPPAINNLIQSFLDGFAIDGFATCLLPHQVEALQFLSTRKAALLAAATGLGKTAISLGFAVFQRLTRILIVCPPTLETNWVYEILRFVTKSHNATDFFMFDQNVVSSKKKKPQIIPELPPGNDPLLLCIDHAADCERIVQKLEHISSTRVCFVLLRYNLLHATANTLLAKTRIKWDAMIFDECHALKCDKSQRSKAAFTLVKNLRPKHTVLLSATPSPSTKDWWNLLRIMEPVLFEKFFHYKDPGHNYPASEKIFYFAERYIHLTTMRTANGAMHWNYDTSARMQELHALTRPYVLCQTKDILQLPPFLREYVIVGEATKQQQQRFAARIQTIVNQDGSLAETQSSFQQLVQQASLDKMPFVKKYIESLVESGSERFILWVHFKLTMQDLAQFLKDSNIKYISINGDTPSKQRDVLLEMFAEDTTIRIALLSIDTCGTGLNMTFVRMSVYAELTYNHVAQIQSEGRCHRIGQRADCVTAVYLIYKHSPDEMIWNSMLRKANIESLVLTNKKADFDYQTQDIKHELAQYLANMQTQRPDVWKCAQTKPPKRTLQQTTIITDDDTTTIVSKLAKRKKQLD